jgi:hypothetical protein
MRNLILILSLIAANFTGSLSAQETPPAQRVWTAQEIFKEKKRRMPRLPIDYCQHGRFAPCVCPQDVAREMQYRPAISECNGNAGVLLTGKYTNLFSVVVRDTENRDRWPLAGFGDCTAYERDELGLNKCSAFKVQKRVNLKFRGAPASLHCFGASGYSTLFKRVVRVTGKIADRPGNGDPLARWCLKRPNSPLN